MDILSFLDRIPHSDFFNDKPCIALQGSEYPLLFFSHLLNELKKHHPMVEALDTQDDIALVIARLEMSFLGNSTIYWLKDIAQLPDKDAKKLATYLREYRGPNKVLFFVSQDLEFGESVTTVDMPSKVDKKLLSYLLDKESPGLARQSSALLNVLFSRTENLSLDDGYNLVRYIRLMGASHTEFINDWLDNIIVPEQSLFILSQYFFAREPQKFFATWQTIHENYAPTFWVTFWSEQVWRAYNFVRLMQEKQFVQAKGIAYRLPFSFIQRDWKKHALVELQQAHTFIYEADYQLKNGAGACSLDLFYSKFLLGEFKK